MLGLDFSTRWDLWFQSPNHLGAWAVMCFFIAVGLVLQVRCQQPTTYRRFAIYALWCVLSSSALLIAWSGSRAAWVAVVMGIMLVLLYDRSKPVLTVLCVGVCIIGAGTLAVDRSRDRLMTISQLGNDGSSISRHRTWSGACQIASVHPFAGVGSGNFEIAYSVWYESAERDDHLKTANNDYLHLFAEHGAIAAGLYLSCVGFGLAVLVTALSGRRWLSVGFGLAVISFAIHGMFNNVVTFTRLWPWTGTCALVFLFLERDRVVSRRALVHFLLCLVVSASICVATVAVGRQMLSGHKAVLVISDDRLSVVPHGHSVRGQVLFAGETDDRDRTLCRKLANGLAERGWQVDVLRGAPAVRSAIQSVGPRPHGPQFLVLLRQVGSEVVSTWASEPPPPIFIGAIVCDIELPLSLTASLVPFPLLFVHGRPVPVRDVDFIQQLQRIQPASRLHEVEWPVTWARHTGRLAPEIDDWMTSTIARP